MPATEVLLRGATQVTGSLSVNYTAGGGTLKMATLFTDHGGIGLTGPFEILVGRNRPLAERRYFVATPAAPPGSLVVTPSPGYLDDQSFIIGDLVDVISAWETQRRLRDFATLHTHTGTTDGVVLSHAALSGIGTNTHSDVDSHIANVASHGAAGAVVGTTNTQTLTNKTLTAPTIADFTNAAHDHGDADDGGALVLPWTDWTPASMSQGVGITFTVTRCRYTVLGKLVIVQFSIVITSAGTAGSAIVLTLPAALTGASSGFVVGAFHYQDQSIGFYVGSINMFSTTQIAGAVHGAASVSMGAFPNFATANTDIWTGTMTYELA